MTVDIFWMIAAGVPITLGLAAASFALGTFLAVFLTWTQLQSFTPLRWTVRAIMDFVLATPPLVHILWGYYALPVLTGVSLSAPSVVILALSASTAALMSEVFRASYQAIPRTQHRAAVVLGLSTFQRQRFVIIPQMIRLSLPPATNTLSTLLKETSLAAVIAVPEILNKGQMAAVQTFEPIISYSIIAILFFVLIYPFVWLAWRTEQRIQS